MGEKKTTVFEINVENLEFSPSASGLDRMLGATGNENDEESTGPSLGLFGSEDDGVEEEDVEIDDEVATEVDVEDAEEADVEDGGGGIDLVIGLLFLLVVAVVAKKFVLDSETEEYEEVELSNYES